MSDNDFDYGYDFQKLFFEFRYAENREKSNNSFNIICEKFFPLIKKYANKIHQENPHVGFSEAMVDFTESLFFITKKIPIEKPEFSNNAILLAYINRAIKNDYYMLSSKFKQKCIEFDYDLFAEKTEDYNYEILIESILDGLTKKEGELFKKKFLLNLSDSDIANEYSLSRQTVNKRVNALRKRLNKIIYEDSLQ